MAFFIPEWEMEGIIAANPDLLAPGPDVFPVEILAQQFHLPRSGGYLDILCRFRDGLLVVELKNEFVHDSHVITHQLKKYLTDLSEYPEHSGSVECLLVSTHGFSPQVRELATARSVRLQVLPVNALLQKTWNIPSSSDVLLSSKKRVLQRRLGLKSLQEACKLLRRRPDGKLETDTRSVDRFFETGEHDEHALQQLGRILRALSHQAPIMAHRVFERDGHCLKNDDEKWFWVFYSVLDRRANAATFVKAREALEQCGVFRASDIVRLVKDRSYESAVRQVFQILRDSEFPLAADSAKRELAMPSSIVDAALYLARFDFSVDEMLNFFRETETSSEDLTSRIMADLRKHIYGVGPRIAAQIVRGFCLKAGWRIDVSSPAHLERCGFNETFAGPGRLGLVSCSDSYEKELESFVKSYLGGNFAVMSHVLWFVRKRFCRRPKRCDECPVAGFCNHFRYRLLHRVERPAMGGQLCLFSAQEGSLFPG